MTNRDDPYRKYGWLMWVTWLIFLLFPASSVLEQLDGGLRLLGLGLIALFGIVYAVGSQRMVSTGPDRRSLLTAGALAAITVLCAQLIGADALGFLPFITSFAAFGLHRPWNWWVIGAVCAVGVITPQLISAWGDWGWFSFILVSVTVGTAVGRLLSDWGEERASVEKDLVVSAERERVARDVHDVLGHSLTVIAVKADLAERLLDIDPVKARAELRDVQRLSRDALGEIRETVGGLRATTLESELASAESATAGAGIELSLIGSPEELGPAYRAMAAWVLREAVTNVIRHSGASHCEVSLGPAAIAVSDDGRGYSGDIGNGLRGLEERVTASEGRLQLTANPDGAGTRLVVTW